jgi:hypothetical protein
VQPFLSLTVKALSGLISAANISTGVWALAAPHSFFVVIAPFPPYNQHLTHDIGAFLLGLGACLACGLLVSDSLLAVLTGNAVGADAHFLSHVVDRDLGGHASDPILIGTLGFLLTVLAFIRGTVTDRRSAAVAATGWSGAR